MMEWWNGLTIINQAFFYCAVFFGVIFLWQLIAAVFGMAGHGDLDMAHDPAVDSNVIHADVATFQLLSFRSILTFFTLFTWYVGMSLSNGDGLVTSLLWGMLWGFAGMVTVAAVFYLISRMGHSGNARLDTCVGTRGSVYAEIPAGGVGEVRCTVSGRIMMVKARGTAGQAIKAGTLVQIGSRIDALTIEVAPENGASTEK